MNEHQTDLKRVSFFPFDVLLLFQQDLVQFVKNPYDIPSNVNEFTLFIS